MTPPSSPAPRAPMDKREVEMLMLERDQLQQRVERAEELAASRWALCQRQAEHIEELGAARDAWQALAQKFGTRTETEWKTAHVLTGSLSVAAELIRLSESEAITYACADLAKRMRAAVSPPRAPLEGE